MGGYSDVYSDLYDPAFPESVLDTRIEVLLGGTWTTIPVYYRDGVHITRGHPDESSAAQPSVGALTVNNRNGAYSPRNPLGPYYGLLGKNTPARISVPEGASYLRMEDDTSSYVSCPDRASLDITGDIDVRIDLRLSNYALMTLATKWNNAGDHAWALRLNANGTPVWEFLDSGAVAHTVTGGTPIPLGRCALRVTWQANNGSGGNVTTFYTAPTAAGPWTQLGSATTGTGALTLATTPAPVVVGYSTGYIVGSSHSDHIGPTGKVYSFALLSGIGGTAVANPVFTAQVAGTAPFPDAQGNLWSFSGTAQISDRKYRHHGEVPAWPQRWDPTGRDVYVPIESSGLLRRLSAGNSPLASAMRRAYLTLTGSLAPLAYWPCEDAAASTSLASGLTSGLPMTIAGTPNLATNTRFIASQPLPELALSTWTGIVPSSTGTDNVLRFLIAVPTTGVPANAVVASMYTSGTVARLDMSINGSSQPVVSGYDVSGNQLFTGTVNGILFNDGTVYRASIALRSQPPNVEWECQILRVGAAFAFEAFGTQSGATLGNVSKVLINPAGNITDTAIGHISVQNVWDSLFDLAGPLDAWQGESAGSRFARLCTEQGVPCRVYGFPADSTAMGAQTQQSFTALLQECEDADRGLMYESRQALALAYRTRVSMLNQAPVVTLDYSLAELSDPMAPTDDDQYTANDVTATRSNSGSTARQTLTSGPMSVQPPPNGIGPYPSSPPAQNLASDTQLVDAAGWLLNLGTVNDVRYPQIGVELARSELAALSGAVQDADIGDRIVVVNTPAWLPPDGISQIVRGTSESPYGFTFPVTWVGVPEAPYRVGVYDDPVLGHYDTDGSTLQGPYSSTATTLLVKTTGANSPLWTTNPADFPFDIEVGGERMTAINITGSSSPQTFTVTRSVNGVVKPQTDGTDVRLFQPALYSM